MKRGDLVLYEGRHWLVQVYDPRRMKIAQLLGETGTAIEIPHDLDVTDRVNLQVLSNPSTDWPFVTVPEKPQWGRVKSVSCIQAQQLKPLSPMAQWVLAEPLRSGGALFLHPGLGLRAGEILQVAFDKPKCSINVTLSPTFGTVANRKTQATTTRIKKAPRTSYDRLLADEDVDE